jgi:hypothetical protein
MSEEMAFLVRRWRAFSMWPGVRRWTERRVERKWEAAGRPAPAPPVLKQRLVRRLGTQYRLGTLVETGTFTGEMVAAALPAFRRIVTIEVDPRLAAAARERFAAHDHVEVIEGDSARAFPRVMAELQEPALCWLDAHYTVEGTAGQGSVPLMSELAAVAGSPVRSHVVLIDDARCFTGRDGFPRLEEIRAFCQAHGGRFDIVDDIIRWYP